MQFWQLATAVSAAVTFHSSDGKGFVGKGNVQLAFGWNNKQLQQNASGVSFEWATIIEGTQECFRDGRQERHFRTYTVLQLVNSEVAHDARVKIQITGFILKDYPAPLELPTAPACRGGWTPVSDPTLTMLGGSLNALHNGIGHVIYSE